MEGEEKSMNTDTSTKNDKLEDKELEDGKPTMELTPGRMQFPRPPSSGSDAKSNTSSNSQAKKKNWK